ncbi:MAG: DedA family protein [Beijerinckiaceae bacterium]
MLEQASTLMIDPMLALLRNNQQWATFIIFMILVLEGVVFTTFIFSGSLLVLAVGVLISNGTFAYWPMFGTIFLGFWIGDTLNFILGNRGKPWLIKFPMINKHAKLIEAAERLISRYDIWAIVFSRFMGPTRPFVTFMAGAFGMRPAVFHIGTIAATLFLTFGLLNAGITGVQLWQGLKPAP